MCHCDAGRGSLTQMGYSGLKPTRPEGACLQMVSLGGASVLCLGDSILISRIGGIFPSRWEADVSLFLSRSRAVAPTLFLSPSLIQSNLALHPPGDRGGTWAPWEGWLSPSPVTWWRRHCIRYRAVSTWSRSKSSQLSHGKMQTRFDKNVMFWRFPLKMDKRWLAGFSRWSGDTLTLLFCSQYWCRVWPLTSGSERNHGDQTGEDGPLLLFSSCLWSWCFHHKSPDS